VTGRVDVARVRDAIRIRDLQTRILAYDVFVESLLVRVRDLIAKGDRQLLLALEDVLVVAIAAGPLPLPDGADVTSVEDDSLRETHRRYRVLIEELATLGPEKTASEWALRARELLGWPRELRT